MIIKKNPGMGLKIAVAQIFCIDDDRAGNLQRIENAINAVKGNQVDLIVFPESVILGWINPNAHSQACPIPGEDSDHLCALAKKHNLYIGIGLDEKDTNQLYDSALLIDNHGSILLKHRKINVLPSLMSPPYSIGNTVNIVDTPFGKIGILICADSFQEDILSLLSAKQPDLVLIPYGWAAEESEWPDHGKNLIKVVQNASLKLSCTVIGANSIGQITHGTWQGKIYGGQSVACNQYGEILGIGKDRVEDIITIVV
ncbi:MAG: carbon-nitrogen hydrolase family protein [Saprospiraceae bacterium]